MIKDALNFIRFQTQDIEHYNQYSIALILFIIVVLEIPSPMLYGGYDMGGVFDIVIDMVFAILFVVITARFLVYWFARKNIQHSFPTVLNFFGVLSIGVSIAGIVFGIIASSFDSSSMAALTVIILFVLYSYFVMTITTSKATGITKAYALSGILIATIIVQIIAQTALQFMNLFWIILGIIVLLLIIFKWRSMSKPSNFAKGVAKAQLKAYETAQIKHPESSKAELITEAISSRLNVLKYYPIEQIRDDAEKHESYRHSMQTLVWLEFTYLTGNIPTSDVLSLMHEQIDSIIPEDL